MTDANPPVADVAPPSPEPLQYFKGQPISREGAAAQMATLTQDPKFMDRVAARDAEAFSEYNQLWRLSRGMSAEPAPPFGPVDIGDEVDARVAAAMQQHAGFYRDRGYSELQQIEIVGQRPVTMEEKRWHQAQYDMKRTSAAFMARWSAGDLEAIKEMNNHAIAMRLPTGTLEDIKRGGWLDE
jgi:hypothetical protein